MAAMPSFGRIKQLSVWVAVAALGVAASSASAATNDVWLWACHGPDGPALTRRLRQHNLHADTAAVATAAPASTAAACASVGSDGRSRRHGGYGERPRCRRRPSTQLDRSVHASAARSARPRLVYNARRHLESARSVDTARQRRRRRQDVRRHGAGTAIGELAQVRAATAPSALPAARPPSTASARRRPPIGMAVARRHRRPRRRRRRLPAARRAASIDARHPGDRRRHRPRLRAATSDRRRSSSRADFEAGAGCSDLTPGTRAVRPVDGRGLPDRRHARSRSPRRQPPTLSPTSDQYTLTVARHRLGRQRAAPNTQPIDGRSTTRPRAPRPRP